MNAERLIEAGKHTVDGLSGVTVLATLAGWLPEISAFFSIIWVVIRIYETDTIQRLLRKKT